VTQHARDRFGQAVGEPERDELTVSGESK